MAVRKNVAKHHRLFSSSLIHGASQPAQLVKNQDPGSIPGFWKISWRRDLGKKDLQKRILGSREGDCGTRGGEGGAALASGTTLLFSRQQWAKGALLLFHRDDQSRLSSPAFWKEPGKGKWRERVAGSERPDATFPEPILCQGEGLLAQAGPGSNFLQGPTQQGEGEGGMY